MIDNKQREEDEQAKQRIRDRIHAVVDEADYEYFPEKKQPGYYDNDIHQRVAVYVRVSTGSVGQTTSFELQKKYYEDFVIRHPHWELVQIYADYGVSGTSLKHRDAFNQMIADCKTGMIDLILTKSVSRFSRNVVICMEIVRKLAELIPPVGVFFESEHIFSMDESSTQALSFLSLMAEEESRTRSRSMEASLRMRLDHGIPLTPKLLGYTHDENGRLVINPEEAPTVKLAFYMYLYGYSTQRIADTFNALGRRSYLGNIKWTSGSIVSILRNERHCGSVLTRKTYTINCLDHKERKNRGQRPQSQYHHHHEAIVSRSDFLAVQRMLDNAKYGGRPFLPQLHIVEGGLLHGFVVVHPRWAGFSDQDYRMAAKDVHHAVRPHIEAAGKPGDFDLRSFEVVRGEFLRLAQLPAVTFRDRKLRFNAVCVRVPGLGTCAELLVDPVGRRFAIKSAEETDRCAVRISSDSKGVFQPRSVAAAAFSDTLFTLLGWKHGCQYRITGALHKNGKETVCIFDAANAEMLLRPDCLPEGVRPLAMIGKRVRAAPRLWLADFGRPFYLHEQENGHISEDFNATQRPAETGQAWCVTARDELRRYIEQELAPLLRKEDADG